MFLKRLELQGFKTFANRTELEFGSGITAIVGPNGSGKSNIADAVRWVLGEQSGRLLRTKKSEDVIFAGSSLRSSAGMADVTLTFDNSTGWLPIDFSEITIGRRIYRSGDSEYYINRSRVRLKDVVELLLKANIGQNEYTVIGQGLVDSALSLRPEERRGLIEEAADIKRYYAKIAEAQNKLESTLQNLSRARDIVAEIGPRLGRLEKQAVQAAEYRLLTEELSTVLATWYYQSWQKAIETLQAARENALGSEYELTKRQEELANHAARIEETRELRNIQRAEIASWQKEQSIVAGKLERVTRQLSIDKERLAYLSQQRRDLTDEMEALSGNIAAEAEALEKARARLEAIQRDTENEKIQLALVQTELDDQNRSQAGLQAELSRIQERSLSAAGALLDARNRLAQLEERDAKLVNETKRLKAEDDRLQAAHNAQLDVATQFRKQLEATDRDVSALGAERERIANAMRQGRETIRGLETELSEVQRQRAGLQSQYDTLAKLQDSHSGLYSGVRVVLQAAKASQSPSRKQDASFQISGVVGIVASLIDVPQHLEVAIEVALGGHLQDIVVEKWANAEAAIELLKATKGGRATFLPLDTMKGGRPAAAPTLPGVYGVASELVGFDERLRNVVRQLLGQTVVVQDLKVAREVMSRLTGGNQIVTIAGEIVRLNGSLTGGATRGQGEGTILARERELRELPEQIRQVVARQGEIEQKLEAERHGERKLAAELVELEKNERQLVSVRQRLENELAKAQRSLDRLRQEAEWQKDLGRQVESERVEIAARQHELKAKLAEAEQANESSQRSLANLQRAAEELLTVRATVQERFNELRTRLAVMDGATASERALMANHDMLLRRLEAQREAKRERLQTLLEESTQLETGREFLEREKVDLGNQVEALAACIEPAVEKLSDLDEEESALLSQESELKATVLDAERKLVQSNMSIQRHIEDLSNLHDRMQADGVEPPVQAAKILEHPDLVGHSWQLSITPRLGALVTAGGTGAGSPQAMMEDGGPGRADFGEGQFPSEVTGQIAADPIAIKRRVDRLRSQLRNLGPVNTSAIEEFEEAKSRCEFLETQIKDLAESEKSLREGISLLETQAQKQFDATFEVIAKEFRSFFSQLFGGGTARLISSDEAEGGPGGIEIVAQPPGKRMQSLALLSGGERALTATALLFAILKVNPTPFCMLDEVDAALDEANVNRFAGALRQLAERTQFIVITHNRGTVELADTLYGVSISTDGVSKMVSLRLEER